MELTVKEALQQGLAAHRAGKLQDAERFYRAILHSQPHHPDANHNLGLIAVSVNKTDEALPLFKAALNSNPEVEQFWLSYIDALIKSKQFETAVQAIEQAKERNVSVESLNRFQIQVLAEDQRSHGASANPPQGVQTTLINHYKNGRFSDAERLARSVTQEFPMFKVAWNILGAVLGAGDRKLEALEVKQKASSLFAGDAKIRSNLANTFKELGRLDEAEANYASAIAIDPGVAEIHLNLGHTQKILGKLTEAESSLKKAILLNHGLAEAHSNLGNVLKEAGEFDEAESSYIQAIELNPSLLRARSNLLFMNASARFDAAKYLKEARAYSEVLASQVSAPFSEWSCSQNPKTLRIGFVSGDLKQHPVGYFLEGLLKELQASSVELYAYTTNNLLGEFTERLKGSFHSWVSIAGQSDKEAAQNIHKDGIHILIDLSGHTSQNRLPIFGWKPAPIQITWLGYFASTGLPEMDFILGDPFVTPDSESHHYTEKIWQLPESYLCFTPPDKDLAVGPLPALANGFLTFGCFNSLSRMTDEVVSVRAEILHAVPNSKLFLKDKQLDHSSGRDQVLARFAVHGIGDDRLVLEGRTSREEYLACYHRVDIALSPFPYGGGTTSIEGLWMGVPVVAKKGDYFLAHLGESIAHNSGLSDWLATDNEDYVSKAVQFSSDLRKLERFRHSLRDNLLETPLYDLRRFAVNFEKALWDMQNL